jgi:uncharacterized membrane protein
MNEPLPPARDEAGLPVPSSVSDNIETIAAFYARHDQSISRSRSFIEHLSCTFGRPAYMAASIAFCLIWMTVNLVVSHYGYRPFDEPPFIWLQGLVASNALIVTITVLIRQNRMALLAEHHAHLDLQVNLLTEKKTSMIITLLTELRRDMPDIPTTMTPAVEEMMTPTDTHAVLTAIEEQHRTD